MVFSHFVILLLLGVIVLSVLVAINDYRFRRIPNVYLLYAMVYWAVIFAGMFIYLPVSDVGKGLFFSVLGLVLGGVFFYPAYKLRMVGAGDVKFVMVLGLFLSMRGVILAVLLGAILGGVWALALAYKHGGLKHMWYNMKYMARSAYLSGFQDMGWDLKVDSSVKMPYGVVLSIGAIMIALEQLQLHWHKLQLLTGA